MSFFILKINHTRVLNGKEILYDCHYYADSFKILFMTMLS